MHYRPLTRRCSGHSSFSCNLDAVAALGRCTVTHADVFQVDKGSLDRLCNFRAMEKMFAIIPPMFLSISHFSIAGESVV